MAKQSSKDALLARIDGDVAKLQEIGSYVARFPTFDAKGIGAEIDNEVAELRKMRDYMTRDDEATAEVKPKRPRGKRKGLPADAATA